MNRRGFFGAIGAALAGIGSALLLRKPRYFEALQRLNAAFSPKPGDLFTHTQLQAVIQADESRYRGVITAWRKELRARGWQSTGMGRARGIGIAIAINGDGT